MRHNHNDKIAVVLVNYNGLNDTLDCIKSIHGADIIVVDNASHSNELSLILEKYPYVIGIQSKENSGFSGGNNFGIHYALKHGYTHIMLLNNDTEIDKDMIRHLVFHLLLEDGREAQSYVRRLNHSLRIQFLYRKCYITQIRMLFGMVGVILTKVQEMQNTGKKGKKTQRILKFKNVLLLQDVV